MQTQSRDILSSRWQTALGYWLPIAAIVITGNLNPELRAVVWTLACLVIGGACLLNAYRCGRIHCYFTGPFFMLMAVWAALTGASIVSLGGENSWNLIGLTLLVGGTVLMLGPELLLGKYTTSKR